MVSAQVFTPPYLLTGQPRPVLLRAPASVAYGQTLEVAFSGTASISRVVLNKLADNTHCISMDHRQACTSSRPWPRAAPSAAAPAAS